MAHSHDPHFTHNPPRMWLELFLWPKPVRAIEVCSVFIMGPDKGLGLWDHVTG